jgi:hypothetical protein
MTPSSRRRFRSAFDHTLSVRTLGVNPWERSCSRSALVQIFCCRAWVSCGDRRAGPAKNYQQR